MIARGIPHARNRSSEAAGDDGKDAEPGREGVRAHMGPFRSKCPAYCPAWCRVGLQGVPAGMPWSPCASAFRPGWLLLPAAIARVPCARCVHGAAGACLISLNVAG